MDCSLPGSSVHGIFQARVLEWVAISFSKIWGYEWQNDNLAIPQKEIPLYMQNKIENISISCSVMSEPLWPHGLSPARLRCPWELTGKNTGVGCHFLLQGVFPTQGSNLDLLHCRQSLLSEPPGEPVENMCLHKNLHTNIRISNIHGNQKVGTT